MPTISRKCEQCSAVFRAHSSKPGRFCSIRCRAAGQSSLPKTFVCRTCGKECENKQGKNAKYCSRACFAAGPREVDLAKRVCPTCTVEFSPRWDTQVFCSRPCGYEGRRSRSRHKVCEHCQTPLRRDVATKVRFCSVRCVRLANPTTTRPTHAVGNTATVYGGYVRIKLPPDYPGAGKAGWMLQHRYVMQEHLRKTNPNFVLLRSHHVHHKDGDRKNNTLENLELTVVRGKGDLKHVPGQRPEELVPGLCRAVLPQLLEYLVANHPVELLAAAATVSSGRIFKL